MGRSDWRLRARTAADSVMICNRERSCRVDHQRGTARAKQREKELLSYRPRDRRAVSPDVSAEASPLHCVPPCGRGQAQKEAGGRWDCWCRRRLVNAGGQEAKDRDPIAIADQARLPVESHQLKRRGGENADLEEENWQRVEERSLSSRDLAPVVREAATTTIIGPTGRRAGGGRRREWLRLMRRSHKKREIPRRRRSCRRAPRKHRSRWGEGVSEVRADDSRRLEMRRRAEREREMQQAEEDDFYQLSN
ncbi:hypothetical protein B296_00047672 [Ensete ventricosum]|uniref:Uncharacterized protein n=1 Tax=Ensete ventricosum TaxID=4639 RepID=A0A426XHJ1_ENSVE|nr:hypothetical protein B296_00047672 [Ensete ventricosum]